MGTRIQDAHLRLMSALPVRTHFRDPLARYDTENTQAFKVRIGDKTYPSMTAVMRSERISAATFHQWLESGKATRIQVDDDV